MNKKVVLTVSGVVAVVAGCVALYLGGASSGMVTELVGGVFVLIGLIAVFFKKG